MPFKLRNGFPSSFGTTDLIDSATVALTQDVWVEVGRVVVPFGVAHALGQGEERGQDSAIGRIYMDLQTATPTAIAGRFRLELRNPNDRPTRTLYEESLAAVRTSASDRRQQLPFGLIVPAFTFNWRLVLLVRAAGSSPTISRTDSALLISITTWDAVLNGDAA